MYEKHGQTFHILQIYQNSVDESNKNVEAIIPSCQLAVNWNGARGVDVPVFMRRINLKGAKNPRNYFVLHIYPSPPPSPKASGTFQCQSHTLSIIQHPCISTPCTSTFIITNKCIYKNNDICIPPCMSQHSSS